MASYHLTARIGGKGKAASHAAYISREGKYTGGRYEDLEATAAGNMPKWAEDYPANFWTAADEFERANGSTYREFEVALPRELNPDQRRELVEDFIAQEIGDKHAYQWAIHTPKAALEKGEQPHAHIMYSERRLDGIERDPDHYFKRFNGKNPEKGGTQKASGGKTRGQLKDELNATRERWADLQNAHLERHGHKARVDHRSLKDQGIERAPEKHLGGAGVRAIAIKDISALLERRAAEGAKERADAELRKVVIDLSGDLSAAKAERTRQQQDAARQAAQAQVKEQAKEQAKSVLVSSAADFRAKFMADRAAKQEQDRQAELVQQAAARAQLEARTKAELERIAQERQRQPRPRGPSKSNDGPDFDM